MAGDSREDTHHRYACVRPRAARVALAGQRGAAHLIVPEVVVRAAALVEGTALRYAASLRQRYRSLAPIS
jgi:hypothetical protein